MTDLFMIREADICPTGLYRWWLLRVWDDRLPLLIIVMLNPSTADAERDDPTVLALIHFAKLWGYGGLRIVNLFAWRASQPAEMLKAADLMAQMTIGSARLRSLGRPAQSLTRGMA